VMVEGGAGVITSFFQSRLVDLIVLTIAPCFVGGFHAVQNRLPNNSLRLDDFSMKRYENDLVVWGRPHWDAER
jgi:riboflavin biosynthesis pyrimidine reductase